MKYNIEYLDNQTYEINIDASYTGSDVINILSQEQEYGKASLIKTTDENILQFVVPILSKVDYQMYIETELSEDDQRLLVDVSGDIDAQVDVKSDSTIIIENEIIINAQISKDGSLSDLEHFVHYSQIIETVDRNMYTDPYNLNLSEELYQGDMYAINVQSKNHFSDNVQQNMNVRLIAE